MTVINYSALFGQRDGSFLLSSLGADRPSAIYGDDRFDIRFIPCSAFKPVMALIAFEEGLLDSADAIIPWDGAVYEREVLNQNLTPRTWMEYSANWANDWVAARVGRENIAQYLSKFRYGNADFSKGEIYAQDEEGLHISPREMLGFIGKLWAGSLPVSPRSMVMTKEILRLETIGQKIFYGKTGSGFLAVGGKKQIGWFIGALENGTHKHVFVTNFTERAPSGSYAGGAAREITRQILSQMNLI